MDVGTTLKYDVVIIGAGPAGMCAGMYAGRSMLKTVVLERIEPGGELLNTEVIDTTVYTRRFHTCCLGGRDNHRSIAGFGRG